MTRILVTGGAGYVGSVSAEAFLAAGHDVVVLDDLTTGHRAAVPAGATLHVGTYADRRRRSRRLLESERIEAILHCAARSLVGESIADPSKYYRDNVAGGVALLEAARDGGRRAARLLLDAPRSTASRTRRRSPRTPRSGRSTRTASRSGRSRARSPGTAGRTACAASPSATSTSPARPRRSARTTTPRRHLIPNVLTAAEGADRADDLRRRLPDARWHLHPRLHPCRRPRRRAPARASRRPPPATSGRTDALALQPRQRRRLLESARSSPRPSRSSDTRSRTRRAAPARATRRSSSRARARAARGPRLAIRRTASLEEMVGSAWAVAPPRIRRLRGLTPPRRNGRPDAGERVGMAPDDDRRTDRPEPPRHAPAAAVRRTAPRRPHRRPDRRAAVGRRPGASPQSTDGGARSSMPMATRSPAGPRRHRPRRWRSGRQRDPRWLPHQAGVTSEAARAPPSASRRRLAVDRPMLFGLRREPGRRHASSSRRARSTR